MDYYDDGYGGCWRCGKGFCAELYRDDDPDKDSGYFEKTGEYLCEECWETRENLDLITDAKLKRKLSLVSQMD